MAVERVRTPSRPTGPLALGATLAVAAMPAHSQESQTERTPVLEEVIVTATRVATSLQETPMSVQALTGEALELSGIDTGRDLGIMVPNVVLTPSAFGERVTTAIIRGLPGVTTYFDGVWASNWGFLQRNFVELERVEVLRGPQGTHFGRNTNGGAIQVITRLPAEEFGARFGIELGEFDHRMLKLAVDVPVSDRLTTKWTAASTENHGFLESQTAPVSLGDRDDSLLRADILWQPTDDFSLRFSANEENQRSSDARIVRISNPDNPTYIAYNVLAGNPDYLARAREIAPAFPDPPVSLASDRFTPETHEPGFPGGTLGEWQTRSDAAVPTIIIDNQIATLTLNWDITDRWSLESLTAYTSSEDRVVRDEDASEFTFYMGLGYNDYEGTTQELHLTGNHFDGRLRSLIGLWYIRSDIWARVYRWISWEFAIPNTGPDPPLADTAAVDYVRAWGRTVGNDAVANFSPPPRPFRAADFVAHTTSTERAFFGELGIALLDDLELTLGFRYTEDDEGSGYGYRPADAFRSPDSGTAAVGDRRAVAAVRGSRDFPDLGAVSSPRVSMAYQPRDDVYLYASYAEGFTQGRIVNVPWVPDPIILDPEIVETRELGLRSDWLGHRMRFNATVFDSRWDGLRVPRSLDEPDNPGQPSGLSIPTSDGVARSRGMEIELRYLPAERWELDFALGLLDTEYLDIGDPPANGSGLQPGTPFQYAPDVSYSLGLRYRLPLARGGELLFAGNYGWMDEYQRASANDLQTKNPDGSNKPEPAYGILNARIVYRPAGRDWQLSVFGTNLTNEWYVNGGENPGLYVGYDYGTIGRPREVGVGLQFAID